MASPSFTGTIAKTSWAGNTSSQAITMPSGITAGEGLIAIVSFDGNSTLSTASSGWVKLGQAGAGTTPTAVSAVFYKANAAGGDTLTVASTVAERGSALCQRITGQDTSVTTPSWAGQGAAASAGTNVGNGPALSGLAAKDYLYITGLTLDGVVTATVAPATYGGFATQVGPTSGAGTSWATKASTASTGDDPGAFTHGNAFWAAHTIAIPPPAGGSPQNIGITNATSTHTAQAITKYKAKTVGVTTVTNTPLPLPVYKVKVLVPATESDAAQVISFSQGSGQQDIVVTPATESNVAQALVHVKGVVIAPAASVDEARVMTHLKQISLQSASEAETAQALAHFKTLAVAVTTELNETVALDYVKPILKTLNPAIEFDVAVPISIEGQEVTVIYRYRGPIVFGRF